VALQGQHGEHWRRLIEALLRRVPILATWRSPDSLQLSRHSSPLASMSSKLGIWRRPPAVPPPYGAPWLSGSRTCWRA
jgi:hypothetical protein